MPSLSVPSLAHLDPLFTKTLYILIQKYSPSDTTTSSLKYATSSVVEVDIPGTMTKGTCWEIAGVGMGMVI